MQLPETTRVWLERMDAESIQAMNDYVRMPREVRVWIISRRPDDVKEWEALLLSFRAAGNASRVLKWFLIAAGSTLLMVSTLWEKFAKFFLGKI